MKSFKNLLNELSQSQNINEVESAADLFQFGIEKGYYTKKQSDEFNEEYWKVKNYHLTEDIYKTNKRLNYIQLRDIVTAAPPELKRDMETRQELIKYINGRIKALSQKKVA